MITRASTASINVSDQDEALEFYTGKLGFQKVKDEPMSADARWIEVAPPGAEIRIVLFKPEDENDIGGFSNIIFECDDMQATYEELSDKGVEFTAEPMDATSWGANAPKMWAPVQGPGRQRVRARAVLSEGFEETSLERK